MDNQKWEENRLKQLEVRREKMRAECQFYLNEWYSERQKEDAIWDAKTSQGGLTNASQIPNFQSMDLKELEQALEDYAKGKLELTSTYAELLVLKISERRFAEQQKNARGDSTPHIQRFLKYPDGRIEPVDSFKKDSSDRLYRTF